MARSDVQGPQRLDPHRRPFVRPLTRPWPHPSRGGSYPNPATVQPRRATAPVASARQVTDPPRANLALLPLAKMGLLHGSVEVVGITGSSGAGVIPSPTTHHPTRAVNLRTYKPLEHQHIPEITETLAQAGARNLKLRFVPVSAPLPRGIFATCFAHIDGAATKQQLSAAWAETFRGEPFVRVPQKRLPEVAAVSVGIIDGEPRLDLPYVEDSIAGVDMNVVMTGDGKIVELQGTAEHGTFARRELDALLEEFNIARLRKTPAIALSGGERRRCEIARALAGRPNYMLLDEPFAGIDPIAVGDIQELVRHLKGRGIGVLITDHNVRETLGIIDRAYIMHDGQLLMEGRPDEVVAHQDVRRVYLGEKFSL